jgi:2-keto-4-pentenoate hydratase/2-oxohepta-3-ene-1,7-dioic acid hydratase in catechol pathway
VTAVLRLARVADGGRAFFVLLEDDGRVREIRGGVSYDPRDAPSWIRGADSPRSAGGLSLLPPCLPSKIIGVGRNYREHAAELEHEVPAEPLLFLKPSSALLPPGGEIRLPAASRRVDYEGELAVVIGREARAVPEERALEHVLGYSCINDVTARDLQARDVQFTRAKGFDTFCPLGPCIAVGLPLEPLVVETHVNGERRQSASISRMIFPVPRLVSFISGVMTLLPGDVIATGTPAGVGPLRPGDEASVSIAGIGTLTNRVV